MKKGLLLLLVLFTVFSMQACTKDDGTVKLKVWVNQKSQDMTKKMVSEFVELYPDKEIKFDITVEPLGEGDAKEQVLKDIDAAADVFNLASDHIRDLVNAKAISKVLGDNKTTVEADNIESSVLAATIDNDLYAYPITADNGYFMYYDKSVYPDQADGKPNANLATLEAMVATAKAEKKNVYFNLGNSFYAAAFLFANGNELNFDGKDYSSNFNNEAGIEAITAMQEYIYLSATNTSNDPTGFTTVSSGDNGWAPNLSANGTLAAGVDGVWQSNDVKTALGDNYGVIKLPTVEIGGEQKQLATFAGFKYLGVKSGSKHPVEANALALFLSNETNQLTRYEELEFAPSNTVASETEEVTSNVTLQALKAQFAAKEVIQVDIPGNYWTGCDTLVGDLVVEESGAFKKVDATKIQELVTKFVDSIAGKN